MHYVVFEPLKKNINSVLDEQTNNSHSISIFQRCTERTWKIYPLAYYALAHLAHYSVGNVLIWCCDYRKMRNLKCMLMRLSRKVNIWREKMTDCGIYLLILVNRFVIITVLHGVPYMPLWRSFQQFFDNFFYKLSDGFHYSWIIKRRGRWTMGGGDDNF